MPRPLLEPVVPALLPLIARALGEGVTAPPAISCLNQLIQSSPELLASHIHDIGREIEKRVHKWIIRIKLFAIFIQK